MKDILDSQAAFIPIGSDK